MGQITQLKTPGRRPAAVVKAEFQYFLEQSKENGWVVKCDGKSAEYADYVKPPTAEQAKEMCEGCPMLALCKEYGRATTPATGIWGGIRWNKGQAISQKSDGKEADRAA